MAPDDDITIMPFEGRFVVLVGTAHHGNYATHDLARAEALDLQARRPAAQVIDLGPRQTGQRRR